MAVHMLCDTCGRKKAAVFYHENIGGRVRTFNLCPACADAMKKSGELEDFSDACAGPGEPVLCPEEPVLLELPIPAAVGTDGAPGLLCPRCGGSLSDLAASGGAGCAVCYTVFAAELAPLLPGTIACRNGSRVTEPPAEGRQELAAAVEAERFEDAAALRDRIRELEQEAR